MQVREYWIPHSLVYNFSMRELVLKLFEGKNIITYNPENFTRDQVFHYFISIKEKYIKELNSTDMVRIDIDPDHNNLFYKEKIDNSRSGNLYEFTINGRENSIHKSKFPSAETVFFKKEIKKIKLSIPYLDTDKRWDSVGLTAAPLFLGSALIDAGYDVNLENISLPVQNKTNLYNNTDLTGFTLFEDIIIEFRSFLNIFPPDPELIVAAGGPFISLNPLSAMYHFPEINLFIRGEGEVIFPTLLNAFGTGNINELMQNSGFFFQKDGLILSSDFNTLNIVKDINNFTFDFSYSGEKELLNGLEMNFSRGCRNNCIFCSKVQGRNFRILPAKNIEQLLSAFLKRLEELNLRNSNSKVININDDDILQDIVYADSVFNEIKKSGFAIWGIQSSITSFFINKNKINYDTIELISDVNLYKGESPLLWLGTDTFIKSRGVRLGKPLPDINMIYKLISVFEKRGISNYHYWISSDHRTTWNEFIEELLIIYDLISKFPRFSILPHSPFLIPYPSTPAYKLIKKSEKYKNNIKYKEILNESDPAFNLELVRHVETGFFSLNRLLKNEQLPGQNGFFDYLKKREFKQALICAYSFIKEDRIRIKRNIDKNILADILKAEEKLSEYITKII